MKQHPSTPLGAEIPLWEHRWGDPWDLGMFGFPKFFGSIPPKRLQVLTCMMELRHENSRPANKLSTINSINPHPSTVREPVWVGRPLDPEITSIHVNSVDSNHNSKMFQVHPQKPGTQGTQMLTSGSSETIRNQQLVLLLCWLLLRKRGTSMGIEVSC